MGTFLIHSAKQQISQFSLVIIMTTVHGGQLLVSNDVVGQMETYYESLMRFQHSLYCEHYVLVLIILKTKQIKSKTIYTYNSTDCLQ